MLTTEDLYRIEAQAENASSFALMAFHHAICGMRAWPSDEVQAHARALLLKLELLTQRSQAASAATIAEPEYLNACLTIEDDAA